MFGPLLRAQIVTQQIPVGKLPGAIAVNPVTNKIYVANTDSNTLTIIDGASGNPTFLGVGASPSAIAINTVTNKIYIADSAGVEVDVVDGVTNTVTPIIVGQQPKALDINPVTNKVYVANSESNTVTVIDGATNRTTDILVGTTPRAVAVNSVTNKIYVADWSGNDVTVIDGATNAATLVPVGVNPLAIAVDSSTNQIVVGDFGSSITMIDGATNTAVIQSTGPSYALAYNPNNETFYSATSETGPYYDQYGYQVPGQVLAINAAENEVYSGSWNSSMLSILNVNTGNTNNLDVGGTIIALAINPSTNKLYVANAGTNRFNTNNVAVVDLTVGPANTYPSGNGPIALAVNSTANKVYVANYYSNNVTVLDGITKATATVPVGSNPYAVAVDEQVNKAYVANVASNNVTVVDGATLATTTIPTPAEPFAFAVNQTTNKVYVAEAGGISMIDGVTNAITTDTLTSSTVQAFDYNPVTNQIVYLSEDQNNGLECTTFSLNVLDGDTLQTVNGLQLPLPAGCNGTLINSIAVSRVTDQVYISSNYAFLVVDLGSRAVSWLPSGCYDEVKKMAIDATRNVVYTTNGRGDAICALDGASLATTLIVTDIYPQALSVDLNTGKVYIAIGGTNEVDVANYGSTTASVLGGTGFNPVAVALNPVTGVVYTANEDANSITAIQSKPK